MKDMIFISHASEDNEFTLWLALQLAKEGYGVWCDLTKFLGAENWPNEINSALQTRTQKFLFVLSKYSNKKPDPLGELTLAFNLMGHEKIRNFIVPLKVDDLERHETDYRLQNLWSIPFKDNWAKGLSQLLEMLERDNIIKHQTFNPEAVNQWWRSHKNANETIINTPEVLISNRYQIISTPQYIYFHHIYKSYRQSSFNQHYFIPFESYLISFVDADMLRRELSDLKIIKTEKIEMRTLIDGTSKFVRDGKQGQYLIVRLFNQCLEKLFRDEGLLPYQLSNNRMVYYFHKKILTDGTIIRTGNNELNKRIKLWGKTLGEKWHWAIRGYFIAKPIWYYDLQYHILISNDAGELRPAPKRVYYLWNNRTFSDRLRASLLHLAKGNDNIVFSFGNDQKICIAKEPIKFTIPVSFLEPTSKVSTNDENE